MSTGPLRYRSLSSRLKERFGEVVRKITLDTGFGCPNRDGTLGDSGCIYCNARGSGTGALNHGLSIREQIDRGIAFLARRYRCSKYIAYFQSFTNTYAPTDRLESLYREAVERPDAVGLAIGTRPDCVPDEVLDLVRAVGRDRLVWIEYGLQSIHDRTLALINRGHTAAAFFDAMERTAARGIPAVAHLILGLPGETVADMVESARAAVRAGVDGVKLHPLYVVRGTALERMVRQGLYSPLSEEEAIEAILSVLAVLPPEVIIHRLTSDPHREELVAPEWMLDKRAVRRKIEERMDALDFRQGQGLPERSTAGHGKKK